MTSSESKRTDETVLGGEAIERWTRQWLEDPMGRTVYREFEQHTGWRGAKARRALNDLVARRLGSTRSTWLLRVLVGLRNGTIEIRDQRLRLGPTRAGVQLPDVSAEGERRLGVSIATSLRYWLARDGVVRTGNGPMIGGRTHTCAHAVRTLRRLFGDVCAGQAFDAAVRAGWIC